MLLIRVKRLRHASRSRRHAASHGPESFSEPCEVTEKYVAASGIEREAAAYRGSLGMMAHSPTTTR